MDADAEQDPDAQASMARPGQQRTEATDASPNAAERQIKVGEAFTPRRLTSPLDRITRRSAGKRSVTKTKRKRGHYVRARRLNDGERATDIAFDATFREAALHQQRRRGEEKAFSIHVDDLRQKVRVRRAANCILFTVDASWSMAAAERIQATKGAILSLLNDAYQKRDSVGLVVFNKDQARVVLRPTSSVDLAQKKLGEIPVGGKTPLSHGLWLSYQILAQEQRLNPQIMPLMILLTDGAGNVPMAGDAPRAEALRISSLFKAQEIRSVVINMEHMAFDRGLAQELANALGGPCYRLEELRAASLVQTVRETLDKG